MTIYRYSHGPIDEIRFITNEQGGVRAYVHASTQATGEQVADITSGLAKFSYKTVPMVHDAKPVLEVRGFEKPEALLKALGVSGLASQTPEIVKTPNSKKSLNDKFRAFTLRLVGYSYNVGDAAYLLYSIFSLKHALKAKEDVGAAKLDLAAGVGYAMGGTALSLFASKDQSAKEIAKGSKKVQQFLQKDDAKIADDASIRQVTKKEKKGFLTATRDMLKEYPSETLNGIYTVVGALLATASIMKVVAIKKKGGNASEDIKDIGLGAITLTSALAGLLIKEKKPIEGEPKRKGLAGVWDWIQEKPLRATGYGFMISTAFHGWATYGKWKGAEKFIKEAQSELLTLEKGSGRAAELLKGIDDKNAFLKTIVGRAVFVAANVFAEVMMVLSSKGHGQGVQADGSIDDTIIANAAQVIAHQDKAQQQPMIDRLAGYMSSPEVMGGKSEAIAHKLHEQVTAMATNPWSKAGAPAAQVSSAIPVGKIQEIAPALAEKASAI